MFSFITHTGYLVLFNTKNTIINCLRQLVRGAGLEPASLVGKRF
jgi:hypothetical protein